MEKLAQFDDIWMAAFREKSGISDEAALSALRVELLEIGARYRRIIETTPCDLKGSPFNKTLTATCGLATGQRRQSGRKADCSDRRAATSLVLHVAL